MGILFIFAFINMILWNLTGYWYFAILTFVPFLAANWGFLFVVDKGLMKFCRGLILIGGTMNFLAIIFNSFKMPVFNPGEFTMDFTHSIATVSTNLPFLCDRFNIGVGIASIGDFFLFASLVLFLILGFINYTEKR